MIIEGLILGLHLMTWHAQPGWNGINPGLYAKVDSGWTAGFYYNSDRRWSAYAGKTFKVFDKVDVTVGGVTGYSTRTISPLVIPSIELWRFEGADVRLAFAPRVPGVNPSALIHFTIEKRF